MGETNLLESEDDVVFVLVKHEDGSVQRAELSNTTSP